MRRSADFCSWFSPFSLSGDCVKVCDESFNPVKEYLMLIFPINTETFKKSFLSGAGQIELQSDQDIWLTLVATGGKFLPTVARVAGVNFKFANEGNFRFGREGGMRLSVSAGAGAEIRLI